MLKLKYEPKDFVVEEISDLKLVKNGAFKIYKLKKENLETIELIKNIAFSNNLTINDIGYAGIKDKRAITTQYISIPSNKHIELLKGKNYSLTLIGTTNKQIETGDLISNKFTITIRNINDFEFNNFQKYKDYIQSGIMNYFDSQRFGSYFNGE
ncbi:MAG: tRNA pseudouridine(13) synthase TruD, partial [Nanoarchaeota archaeon]|nr:tRNA pseudouridine(13) synthase TruD [Nanoarchaeota archaeon]